jgi:hypothetical protein
MTLLESDLKVIDDILEPQKRCYFMVGSRAHFAAVKLVEWLVAGEQHVFKAFPLMDEGRFK